MAEPYTPVIDISALQSILIENYCSVAATALIAYDHLSTVNSESILIWGKRWNSVTTLFHLNRWAIFLWAILNLVVEFVAFPTLSSCVGFNNLFSALELLLFTLWALFSGVRTYAVSGGSWLLTLPVVALDLVPVGMNAYGFFAAFWFAMVPGPGNEQICVSGSSVSQSAFVHLEAIATRACVMASDALVLIVTWYKTYSIKRNADQAGIQTPLASLLLRDGTMYFVVLLCLNILNIVGKWTNGFAYASLFSFPSLESRLSSIIISHFLLNLRQVAYQPQDNAYDTRLSFVRSYVDGEMGSRQQSLRFASFVGNMGELVEPGFDHDATEDSDLIWDGYEDDSIDLKDHAHLQQPQVESSARSTFPKAICTVRQVKCLSETPKDWTSREVWGEAGSTS
ncbi:hypothetical protein CERSUDRAFT_76360 [Gelatoporia subvermispora B]|uniref:DUF6533 domain-containing protein n=1 Tax=Ceriporiopsis subvermispora (strain B) TaxID=914234 RepID=M2R659_CERS8|nr:hypothetical protein CERSUDRAFT_76360 [Gelatoporia subvermispora B]